MPYADRATDQDREKTGSFSDLRGPGRARVGRLGNRRSSPDGRDRRIDTFALTIDPRQPRSSKDDSMPGQSHDCLDTGSAGRRRANAGDDQHATVDYDHRVIALEKQIASQRRLSDLLEPSSPARAKSDAICLDMIETLERLRSQDMRRAGH
jgi:hypothetical protein